MTPLLGVNSNVMPLIGLINTVMVEAVMLVVLNTGYHELQSKFACPEVLFAPRLTIVIRALFCVPSPRT